MKFALVFTIAVLLAVLLLVPHAMPLRLIEHSSNLHQSRHNHHHHHHSRQRHRHSKSSGRETDDNDTRKTRDTFSKRRKQSAVVGQGKPDTVQVAGSGLPDCTHACGSCKPCKLVTVSFVCASLSEAETCPMAYKCMCKNKSFPVP